jgi:ankyrin repeat protein
MVASVLLDNLTGVGDYVNQKGPKDRCALHTAAAHGHVEVVKLLISKGADVNVTADALTPLSLCASKTADCWEVAKELLQAGARLYLKKPPLKWYYLDGSLALHLAVRQNNHKIVHVILQHKWSKWLLSLRDEDGHTPLTYAVKDDHINVLNVILKHKPSLKLYECGRVAHTKRMNLRSTLSLGATDLYRTMEREILVSQPFIFVQSPQALLESSPPASYIPVREMASDTRDAC